MREVEQLCDVTSSKRIYASELKPSGVPFLRSKEIIDRVNGSGSFLPTLFISEERFQEILGQTGAPKEGDLLLTSRGTLGVPYIVRKEDRFHFADGNLTWFRNFRGIESRFLRYFLLSPLGKAELAKSVIGSSQQAYTIAALKKSLIPCPPISTQIKISDALEAYDDLIENNQRRIRILEEMARRLYREWFVHFRFPGHENHPRVPSPLGEIPQGWEVRSLECLMVHQIGGGWGKDVADDTHTEPAWVIRGTDIPGARNAHVDSVPYRYHTPSNLRSRRLQTGDIVFEVSGGSKGQPVGRTLLITPELLSAFGGDDVMCASFCKRIQPDQTACGPEMLYLSFLEAYESGEIEQYQVQSTGISNFKWTEYIANTSRVVPPDGLRKCFQEIVRPLLREVATLGLKSANLRRTRDLLLPRLLSGQIKLEAN
jgi:type I restriction enzyme S subunit